MRYYGWKGGNECRGVKIAPVTRHLKQRMRVLTGVSLWVFHLPAFIAVLFVRPDCPKKRIARFTIRQPPPSRPGFRPCLMCRPELAPGAAPIDATSALARNAANFWKKTAGAGKISRNMLTDLAVLNGICAGRSSPNSKSRRFDTSKRAACCWQRTCSRIRNYL